MLLLSEFAILIYILESHWYCKIEGKSKRPPQCPCGLLLYLQAAVTFHFVHNCICVLFPVVLVHPGTEDSRQSHWFPHYVESSSFILGLILGVRHLWWVWVMLTSSLGAGFDTITSLYVCLPITMSLVITPKKGLGFSFEVKVREVDES